ncbi:MAG TPA: hypothetical protein VLX91_00440 [Candidatus Acidoferrales bacterium]|nr:hypothetical protein [Candidatus Acidoferrales bacterium]
MARLDLDSYERVEFDIVKFLLLFNPGHGRAGYQVQMKPVFAD